MTNKYLEKLGYSEGHESTFSHAGSKYSVDKAISQVAKQPIVDVLVKDLKWVFDEEESNTTTDPDRVQKADLQHPIILAKWNGKLVPVDGAHRLKKAINEGKTHIKAKMITPEQLEAAKLKNG